MKTFEVCNRDVAAVKRDTPLAAAATLMRERHVGSVIVVDQLHPARPVGIVTDRDIVIQVVAAGLDHRAMTAGEIMSAPLATARADDDAFDTLKAMRIRGIRRMPVLDDAGWLVGIAALDDLLEVAGSALNDVVGAITSARSHERLKRR